MAKKHYVQCEFLIPIRRDKKLSEGKKHSAAAWEWLREQLWDKFRAFTVAPLLYTGIYEDPDDGSQVKDESKRYEIALATERLKDLRALLQESCSVFEQKCIYLSVASRVEFVRSKQ